jgi:hypothetical protein
MVMATSFEEFLQKKAEEFGHFEQVRQREEWIAALRHLYDSIAAWLVEADPGHLLKMSVYDELDHFDSTFGPYAAPIMKISLGRAEVHIKPVGRRVIGFARVTPGEKSRIEGRVDISNGVRKYILYRMIDTESGQETWCVPDDEGRIEALGRAKLEAILQDLWS